ncbi:hypothetical protein HPP92_027807 [Vanilla planifolia]|uniref:F-box protein n=1 Tax=Vanilla planifolia TaxID=51239 RepID=A0A835PDK1_VANPL|nr:hypothetical protein HPP92_027807 [Vanilla planifolia]
MGQKIAHAANNFPEAYLVFLNGVKVVLQFIPSLVLRNSIEFGFHTSRYLMFLSKSVLLLGFECISRIKFAVLSLNGIVELVIDIDMSAPLELGSFSSLLHMQFMGTERPWLSMYGNRIRPVVNSRPFDDPSLIHHCLPDELLFEVFSRMSPYSLGRAACVCRKWRYTVRNPIFWRSACLKTWQLSGAITNYRIVQSIYEGSWRKMWINRPRIRHDGLYVSRNTYIHTGVAEWKVTNASHLVCYFRYLRFFPSGKFLYKISPQKVKEVAKFMNASSKANSVFKGDYTQSEDQIDAVHLYSGSRPTLLRMRLRIRGTTVGANNRLDLLRLVTTGVNESEINNEDGDILGLVNGWQEEETHNPDVPAISHIRGLSPFIFIPFEEVETSIFNLPVEKMDYYVPG